MKRILPLFALLAACTITTEPGEKQHDGQTITFSFDTSDGFIPGTRVAQIYSSDALQAIEACRVFCFNTTDGGTTWKFYREFDLTSEWNKGQNRVVHTIMRADMIPNGQYRFLAVGTDNKTDYNILPAMTTATTFAEVYATLGAAAPQEIFAGFQDKEFNSSSEDVTIFMQRRVAGVMLYVKNVPLRVTTTTSAGESTTRDVRYLRLTLAGSNTRVDITSNPETQPDPTAATGAAYDIFNIDLQPQGDNNGDGYYDGTPNVGGVEKVPNSSLIGAYVVPVGFSGNQITMTLALIAPDGVTQVKRWTVLNNSTDATFNILSNHFYSIGKKLQSANTINGNTDPDDDDDPIDIAKQQTITAIIGAGWRDNHATTIEEAPVR